MDTDQLTEDAPQAQEASSQPTGDQLREVARALTTAVKTHYGRGPVSSRAHMVEEDVLVVVMRGGATTAEKSMVREGREDDARQFRLAFQDAYGTQIRGIVENITGRTVGSYHSQILFEPDVLFEIFVFSESRGSSTLEDGE
jgi:uncharacterized protein YbcI